MKQQYIKPLIEVVEIQSDDIITTSKYGSDLDSDQEFEDVD